jgi:Tol biopolymer transport system component
MHIQPGQNLLHYNLVEKIGEGGMGEVWKAVDSTLDREVAIKVLPEAFDSQPERAARFEREAKLLASLNHPNIASVYGLHRDAGTSFIAMEYVPGEDLSAHIAKGLTVDAALTIAVQVAEALETAHEQGVIHRDLKPANVRLTPDGKAKVLDFGLAKGLDAGSDEDPSSSPTVTSLGTVAGVILGTAAYMSPEQARGQNADRRSDVWSFGSLLYEMLASRRPFEGDTISDTLAAVLRAEPNWSSLSGPPAVSGLVRRCLVKDPRRRLQAIGEARVRLEEEIENPQPTETLSVVAAPRGGATWKIVAAAAAIVALLAIIWGITRPTDTRPPIRAQLALDPPMATANADLLAMPDGESFFYISKETRKIFEKRLSDVTPVELAGTEGAQIGGLSPDGEWIAFFSDRQLRMVPRVGGVTVALAPVQTNPRGVSWSENGFIYYTPDAVGGIWRVSEEGGEPEEVTVPPNASEDPSSRVDSHRWPTVLPGDKAMIYLAGSSGDFGEARIELLHFESNEVEVLQTHALFPRYLDDGRIAFVSDGKLMTMGFDVETLKITSTPVVGIEGVAHSFGNGGAEYSVSSDGTLVYQPGFGSQVEIELQWLDDKGRGETIVGPTALFHPRFSPDGRRVAFTRGSGSSQDIWVYDVERGIDTRLTLDATASEGAACWGPDDKSITFYAKQGGEPAAVYRMPANGSAAPRLLIEGDFMTIPTDWSSDGSMLLFFVYDTESSWDLMLQRFNVDGEPDGPSEPIANTSSDEFHGSFSPDDRYILYTSSESGTREIYLRSLDGSGRWQVSDNGGVTARWGPGGTSIVYQESFDATGQLKRVEVTFDGGVPRLGRPQTMVRYPIAMVQTVSGSFDVNPVDGRLVVAASLFNTLEAAHPVLIQDWSGLAE